MSVFVDFMIQGVVKAEAEANELRVQLDAWHTSFGTTQLTHALAERDTLITALRECVVAASDMLDYDQENQVPVCNCCGMELDGLGKGHKIDCLAELVLSHASTLERYKHEHP